MKNTIISVIIFSIVAYVVLNYQVTQYHFYENATLTEIEKHRSLANKSFQADMDFVVRDGFNVSSGTGMVLEYAKLIKKATPNVNDDTIDAFTIYLPFSDLKSGDSKSLSPSRGVLVYYVGSRLKAPCYGYSTNGKVTINSKDEKKLKASISFIVDLVATGGGTCRTINFNEDVTFKKASPTETWRPK